MAGIGDVRIEPLRSPLASAAARMLAGAFAANPLHAKAAMIAAHMKMGVDAALVVHAGVDDLKTDPAGNAGDRIACGVVGK